jgi:TRAP-type C4-dicarboxylate transport system substrate-binding protein
VLSEVYRKKYGIVPLAFFPGPMQVFYCSEPVKGLTDFKGRKIRVWSTGMGDFVAAAGGIPVTMPMSEVVSSLQRKVVDCAVTGTMAGNQAKWFEVTSHYYPLAMGWSIWLLGINEATWDKIKPELREVLQKEVVGLENEVWKDSAEETEQGSLCNTGKAECKLGSKGAMTLVQISPADLSLQKKIMEETVLPKWSKACGRGCAERWNATIGKALGMTIR